MQYYDTNVLIYFMYQFQDDTKHKTTKDLITKSINTNKFLISPLVIQEFIYSASRIDKRKELIKDGFTYFESFVNFEIDRLILIESFEIAEKLNYFQNINDCIHIKFAERHCRKLITFDNDFEKFRAHTNLEIEILK